MSLNRVELFQRHGVETHHIVQFPLSVEQGQSHGHHVPVGAVDGLGDGDFLLPPDDLRRDAGGKRPVRLQIKGGFPHNGVVGKAEIPLIVLTDPEYDAAGVGEHHLIRQKQVVFRVENVQQAADVDVFTKIFGKLC